MTSIDAHGGRVGGVRLADGEPVAADTVVATVMPHALIAMAGDASRGSYRRLLGRYRYGPATVKVDWALDGPIPWSAPAARRPAPCTSQAASRSCSTRSPRSHARPA